ncbi:MAG: diguanylate cyclase [Halofilum sp. (in: g-proteobacteria)]|nr:diguanylate cyclase [Halofilum sp. (in: g-proteobacteria)]
MTERPPSPGRQWRARPVAIGIALAYTGLGLAWIILSDRLALAVTVTPDQLARVQAWKGFAYVALTGGLLYLLVHRFLAALERSNRGLSDQRDRLLELSRVQALVRAVNATLLRVNDEELLLRAACRATVREGGFAYAWIGLLDRASGRLEQVASAGGDTATGPAELVSIPLDGDTRSVVTDALADGQPHALRGHGDPWLDRAVPAGLAFDAAIVLPLRTGDGVAGVVVIYGRQNDDLEDPEEMRLLAEVADNMGLGISYLRQRRTLQHLTYHDELTGIGNRQLIEHRLVAALNNAEQRHAAVAVIVLDIDRFRETNDTGGRAAGDAVLTATAQILGGVIRPGDTVGRLGNDEFAVIFADLPSVELVNQLAGRVADRFPERIEAAGLDVYLSVSMGVAVYPDDGASAQEVISRAELALHSQSGDQTGAITYYAPSSTSARARRELELALRSALDADEFRLEWQPIVDIDSGATLAARRCCAGTARLGRSCRTASSPWRSRPA